MSSETFKNISDGVFHTIAALAILAGGIWAVYEFYETKEHQRIERSMKYVSSLETRKVNQSIDFIQQYWNEYFKSVAKPAPNMTKIVTTTPKYQENLQIILNHLDEISICIKHNVCEEAVVLKTKRGLFFNGFVNHYDWIEYQRELTGYEKFHHNLECFIKEKFSYDSRTAKLKTVFCE